MKYNIVFSIPIHEKFEVVVDQVLNFFCFNPNCAIVFHISQGFNYKGSSISKERFIDIINGIGNVYLNPESVRTGLGDIIQAHISNYNFIKNIADFKYFSMCASNELFVKPGLYEYINKFDCGVKLLDIDQHKFNDWTPGIKAKEDEVLTNYLKNKGIDKIYGSHIEGSYYKKDLFDEIVNEIAGFYDYKTMSNAYPREEIYFSSVLWMIMLKKHDVKINSGGVFSYTRWNGFTNYKIWIWDINRLKNRDNLFSVKRVDRSIDARFREYARIRFGYKSKEADLGILNYTPESLKEIKRKELADISISYLKAIKIAVPYYFTRLFDK